VLEERLGRRSVSLGRDGVGRKKRLDRVGSAGKSSEVGEAGKTAKELEKVGDALQKTINGLDKRNNEVVDKTTDKQSHQVLDNQEEAVNDGVGGNLGNDGDKRANKRNLAKVSQQLVNTSIERVEGGGQDLDLGGSVSRRLDENVDGSRDERENSLNVGIDVLNSVPELSTNELVGSRSGSRSSKSSGGQGGNSDDSSGDHCGRVSKRREVEVVVVVSVRS
jgi:hypothetical protein